MEVGDAVLSARFGPACTMENCRGRCCALGVEVDLVERDRIFANAALVQRHMDPDQELDPNAWFEDEFSDSDFPTGRAVSTRLRNGGCVFLNGERFCVLHTVESLAQPAGETLKPFFCRAYPLGIVDGVLTLDDEQCPGQTECCGPVANGARTIFDVCPTELEFVLGAEGVNELQRLAKTRPRATE